MTDIWNSQFGDKWVSKCVEQRLQDQFKQFCLSEINTSAKTLCYRIYNTEVKFKNYFNILPSYYMHTLCKFRCGSHRLPIETGRWRGVSRNDRLCHLCNLEDIGDEYHYYMTCKALCLERKHIYHNIPNHILKLNLQV